MIAQSTRTESQIECRIREAAENRAFVQHEMRTARTVQEAAEWEYELVAINTEMAALNHEQELLWAAAAYLRQGSEVRRQATAREMARQSARAQ